MRQVRIAANAVNQLEGGDTDKTKRILGIKVRDTAVADKNVLAVVGEPAALIETLIQAADLLFINTGVFQFQTGMGLELGAFGLAVMTPIVEPALVIALQQGDVGLVHDREQELDDLGVFKTAVNIIAAEDIERIITNAAEFLHELLQSRVTAMDIADDMDSFVLTKVCLAVTHSFQRSVRGDDLNAARDLLCSEAGIHFINDFLRDALDGGTLCIAALAFLNGQVCHIDQIGAVAILFGESLITVHFRRFGIGGIDNCKAASLHTKF